MIESSAGSRGRGASVEAKENDESEPGERLASAAGLSVRKRGSNSSKTEQVGLSSPSDIAYGPRGNQRDDHDNSRLPTW